MKFDNQLRYAVRVVEAYTGDKPLHLWFKEFFRANPQMGSSDRRFVSEMVYSFYRLGHTLKNIPVSERILCGLLLCAGKPLEPMAHLRPEWYPAMDRPLAARIGLLQERHPEFSVAGIFPWHNMLSADVDPDAFCLSFLKKPEFFIRVRAGKEQIVEQKLRSGEPPLRILEADAARPFRSYAFPTGTRIEDRLELNRDAVVQDLSSQKTARILKTLQHDPLKIVHAWDCCAASGGKSILLADLYPTLDLTVTDIRKSILEQLRSRFGQAGLTRYRALEADLSSGQRLPLQAFDMIVADLPCTGSGTWARTPESLYFFDPDTIAVYRSRQEKMLSRIVSHLKPGGLLLYITCSVFAAENETVVSGLQQAGLKITETEMITGYNDRADSLFAAGFIGSD